MEKLKSATCGALLLASVTILGNSAMAYDTGRVVPTVGVLYLQCKGGGADLPAGQADILLIAKCASYFGGVTDMANSASLHMWCIDNKIGYIDMVDAFEAWEESHPERDDEPAVNGVMESLHEKFPCPTVTIKTPSDAGTPAAPMPSQHALAAPPAAAVRPPAANASGYPVGVGQSFRDCADCPEMMVIPPGDFQMGSDESSEEQPIHRVRVNQALAVGKYHVTRGEYARFVQSRGYAADGGAWRNVSFSQTDRDPVVNVSWVEAKAYAGWLSRTTGKGYRLLTEAEWEYAARGGTATARWWGDGSADQCKYAHGANQTNKQQLHGLLAADCSDGYVFTSPVGSFTPNPFGLYDMLGDAWQWVEDCWADTYANASNDASVALVSGGDCDRRVLRGGSWINDPRDLRAAVRIWGGTRDRFIYVGFRVARTPAG